MAEYRGVFAAPVDFGEEPASPTESIMETIKGILGCPQDAESQPTPAKKNAPTGTRPITPNQEQAEAAE